MKTILYAFFTCIIMIIFSLILNIICQKCLLQRNYAFDIQMTDAKVNVYDYHINNNKKILYFTCKNCNVINDFSDIKAEKAKGKYYIDKDIDFKCDSLNFSDFNKNIYFDRLIINLNKMSFSSTDGLLDLNEYNFYTDNSLSFEFEKYKGFAASCNVNFQNKKIDLHSAKLFIDLD